VVPLAFAVLGQIGPATAAGGPREAGALRCDQIHGVRLDLAGPMGERVRANIDNWLLRAPEANPGMLEMFRRRDREPVPDLVPWAGEFVGKYLISAIQACRMTTDGRLKPYIASVLRDLIATQADDGYLGPFRRADRLLGQWDLWGHYHAMLALLMWHEDTGDAEALGCAMRAGDLICNTFLDTGRRVYDAGSYEMNMAVITSLGRLYRHTGDDRYLRMMRQIEEDWQKPGAGDYFRTGLDGIDFHRTPRPRWESLHDLQGLVELYRITGDEPYRRAFEQHWTSIVNHDRHPSGAYSTNEQSVGNPYSLGAIETCCTTAWAAITVDMLKLTADPKVADELELSTWNSILGSQHPSGRWWTYDTPLDGVRQASAHHIVFQARFGTPELNCCSANAPRGIGMISEWGLMADAAGPLLNYYGPGTLVAELPGIGRLSLAQDTKYPAEGTIHITVGLEEPARFPLRLRIPAWTAHASATVDGRAIDTVSPGTYLTLDRAWRDGDRIELDLDMTVRTWSGELARSGHAVIYRGPLLLAYDQKYNAIDVPKTPTLDLAKLDLEPARVEAHFPPMVAFRCTAAGGEPVVLCDFASAGANGTDYRTWLPATNGLPAPFCLSRPRPGETIATGPTLFEWTAQPGPHDRTFRLTVSRDAAFTDPVVDEAKLTRGRFVLEAGLQPGTYYWRVVATNPAGEMAHSGGARSFTVDPAVANTLAERLELEKLGPGELMVASPLDGDATPSFGRLARTQGIEPAADRHGRPSGALRFSGDWSMAVYQLPYFPETDYSFTVWVRPDEQPRPLAQLCSAWSRGMDDPLRVALTVDGLVARIEAGGLYGTPAAPMTLGEWTHVAAVKRGTKLSLYINGAWAQSCDVPWQIYSSSVEFAIGGNPLYTGASECFVGCMDDFALYARALTDDEVAAAAREAQ